MKEETRIIIKNELIKSADDIFTKESPERNEANRSTYILGSRKLLILLLKYNVSNLDVIELIDDLDINKVKL